MAKKKPIVSPLGQWAYPGEVTIIPSSNITMKGVNYPVLGIDDLGNSQMMMPGQDYTFPGDYVTEIPQMGKGGLAQWFAEEWTDVKTGKPCGRSGKEKGSRPYPACRPKKRVNETTPKTTSEMSSAEKAKFKREKTSGKRIDYNHKRRQNGGQTGWLEEYQDGDEDIQKRLNRYMAQDNNRSYAMPNGLSFNTGLREIQQEYLNQNFPTDKLGDLSPQVLKALRNSAKNLKLDYNSSLNLPEKLGNIGYKSSYSLATPKSTKDLLTNLTYTKSFPGGNIRATTDSQQLNLKSKDSNLNIDRSVKDSKVSNQFNFNTKVLGDALNVYGAGQFNPNDALTVRSIDPFKAKTNIKGNIGVKGTTKNLDYNVKGNYNPKTGLNYQGDAVLRMLKDRLNVSGSATTKDQLLDSYNLDASLKLGKNLNLSAFRKNKDDEISYGAGVKGNLGPVNLSGNVNYNSNAMRNYNIAADVDLLRSTRENPNRGNLNLSGNYGASMDEMGTMSPNYGLNLKYTNSFEEGGWLDQYQTGGSETTTFLNPDRMGEIIIKGNKNNKNNFSNLINNKLNKLNKFLGKDEDLNFNDLVNKEYVGPLEDSWNWTKQYMSSPRYKEMLESKDPDNSIQITRAHNLFTIPDELYENDLLELSGKGGFSDVIDGSISVSPDYDNSILTHEISHSVDRPKFYKWDEDYYLLGNDRQIPKEDVEQIKKRIKNNPDLSFTIPFWEEYGSTPEEGTLNYFTNPTEVRARLNEFRQHLYLKHLENPDSLRGVDIFNKPVKKENLDNISIPDDFNRYYNDDDFLWLLNNVSKTEQPKLNIAKYGGWLNKYQTGGWAGWTPNVGKPYMRTSPAGNAGYTDNTRVVNQNTNVSAENRKAAEAAEYAKRIGSISQGRTKSAYEKAREASSFVEQEKQRTGSAGPLSYVLDMVNPAAIGFAGVDLINNLGSATSNTVQGNFAEAGSDLLGAGLNALGVIPAAAAFKGIVKPLSKFARLTPGQYKIAQQFANNPLNKTGKYLTTQTPLKNTYKYNPWAFKADPEKYYRQFGKPGFKNALEEGKIYGLGQKDFMKNYPEYDYLNAYNTAIDAKKSGIFYLNKPAPAPFVKKGDLFFPINRRSTGTGYKLTKFSDAEYLAEGSLPEEAVLPKFQQQYLPSMEASSNVGVIRPEFSNLDNFKLYKRDWLRGYKPIDVPNAQSSMNLSKMDGSYLVRELLGEAIKGNQNRKAIAEGNAWLKNWIDDPITQTKIDTDLGWIPQRSNILKDKFSLGYEQAKSFTPVSKEYPFSEQLNDYFIRVKPHIHSDNSGVSYLHSRDPYSRSISEQFNDPRLKASWISRNPSISKPVRRSTTVHEGTHDWTSDFLLRESGQMGDIRNLYSDDIRNLSDQWKSLRNSGINPSEVMGRENATLGYLADPTEVHARIMELRQLMKMTPEQSVMVTPEKAADIITKVQNPKNAKFVDPRFLDVIDKDPKKLATLFNRLWAVSAVATASQLPEQKNGGWLDTYQDGGENLPELNSKIDIANFYKNPLSEKYGIYQDPEDNTYKYYLKSGDENTILESGPDLTDITSRRLAEINSQKGSLSDVQLANIKNVSPVILPEQKQRILRDKVYYDQENLLEEAISDSPILPVKTPSYKEILESDPEFKKVMTEKPKPVPPIKPKPVAADAPIVPIADAPRAIVKPAVRKVVAKNNIVNLADLTLTKSDLAYLNKTEEYCPSGNCLETTRNAYDMLPGRIQGIPTSSDIWSNDLKIHSKKGTPTANDIKQYPYFAGDSGSGTVDSWDIHGVIVANGGKNLFNINNPTPIDYKQIPVGAVIGWGPANQKDSSYSGRSKGYNKKFGMQPSHHSTMVTGYTETGEPIVYDGFLKKYMTLTEAKANIGSKLSYELENISAPKSVLNNIQDNLASQGILLNYIPPTNINSNKILAAANQPWAQVDGRPPRFNKEMVTEFNSALTNNKGELMRNLNMSSEKYDVLSKIALAIEAQESEGGGALLPFDNDSVGMTQLITDNIYNDDKLKKAASKPYMLNDGNNNILSPSLIQKSPSASAVATMIYLSQLDKSAQAKYAEGKIPKERSITKINYFKDKLRSNTAKYNSDGFFVEEANKRVDLSPFEGGILSSPDPIGAQKLLNKTAGTTDRYKVEIKNGDLVIKYKTKGNADLSYPEIIAYGWQSLNTLKQGDAQGDSIYTRRIKNYYDLLNNTTPTYREKGGETGWLNKYK